MSKLPKTIVFFCWPFPPLGGGGISRAVNFSKQLSSSQYKLIVVTGELNDVEKARHKSDTLRLKEIPESVKVVRLSTRNPEGFKAKLDKVLGERLSSYFKFLVFPLLHTHISSWSLFNFFRFRKILKEEQGDLFITTSPPHSQLFTGLLLKITTSSKWIADLRDPYTDGYQWSWPSPIHFKLARWLEKLCLSRADRVLVNTPAVERLYKQRNLVRPERMEVLTNGF